MENQTDASNQQQNDGGSPLLAVLFIGQLITILAIAGLGWLVQNEMTSLKAEIKTVAARGGQPGQPSRPPEPAEPQFFSEWKSIIRPFNVSRGPEDAPVTIVEFSDFQCTFCSRFYQQTLGQLLQDYDGKIRFVYKHLPLTQIHPFAVAAGVAFQCANKEDSGKAWKLHDIMFDNFRDLNESTIKNMGKEAGLSGKWESCFTNQETLAEVEQDSEDAMQAGARGTPAFLINGKFMSGAQPLPNFKREIDAILSN